MAGVLKAVAEALKQGPKTKAELAKHCNSEHAVIQAIYRLRKLGYVIQTQRLGRKNEPQLFILESVPQK